MVYSLHSLFSICKLSPFTIFPLLKMTSMHYLPVHSSYLHLSRFYDSPDTLLNHPQTSYEYASHLFFVVVPYDILWIHRVVYILGFQIYKNQWTNSYHFEGNHIWYQFICWYFPSFQISSLVFHFFVSELSSVITLSSIPVHLYTWRIQSWWTISYAFL